MRIEELQRHPHAKESGASTHSAAMGGVGHALHLPCKHKQRKNISDSLGTRLPWIQKLQQAGILITAQTQLSDKTHTKQLQPRYMWKGHKP